MRMWAWLDDDKLEGLVSKQNRQAGRRGPEGSDPGGLWKQGKHRYANNTRNNWPRERGLLLFFTVKNYLSGYSELVVTARTAPLEKSQIFLIWGNFLVLSKTICQWGKQNLMARNFRTCKKVKSLKDCNWPAADTCVKLQVLSESHSFHTRWWWIKKD